MTDLKKLRELAVAATPNWTDKQVRDEDGFSSQVGIISCGRGWTIFGTPVGGVAPQRNHDYLLAANPQAIIEILDMLERYREALVRARCEMLIVLENHSKVEMLSPLAIDEALEGGK